MSSVTSILKLRRHSFSGATGARVSARRFAGYTQYRDQHPDSEPAHDVDGLVDYVQHRDVTSPRGRMFDATGPVGAAERDRLVSFVDRSFTDIHVRDRKRSSTNNLGYYDLIISPEDSRGIDLRAVTRATMAQLGRDAGTGGLPPWVAAEHRNTRHPHVHVVLAGIRRIPSGSYRTLNINRGRLEAMKTAMTGELARQRGEREEIRGVALSSLRAMSRTAPPRVRPDDDNLPTRSGPASRVGNRGRGPREQLHPTQRLTSSSAATVHLRRLAARLANHYRGEMQRAIRDRSWSSEYDRDTLEHAL